MPYAQEQEDAAQTIKRAATISPIVTPNSDVPITGLPSELSNLVLPAAVPIRTDIGLTGTPASLW